MSMFSLAHINAYFILDGQQFEVEHFNTSYAQASDYKGQPQHEVRGGQLTLTLAQSASDSLYLWAKTAQLTKSGQILFQTDLGITVLRIGFENAYCVNLSRSINVYTGTKTTLIITSESININGVTHDNRWNNKGW